MSRASKQLGTNVTKKLLTEMQALIAFACYDSPAIAQGGDSMTDNAMAETMTALYFGADDPEIICYLDQFINGLHRFTGLFTSSEPDEFGQMVLTMPQKLHRHGGLNIFVGPTSITKELLSKKNFANNEKITGRTLLKKAKDVVATCKKMMGLATATGSPYRDGTFPSGTNWDDYIKWCLVAMQNDCDREAKAKQHVNVVTTESSSAATRTTTIVTAETTACCAVATTTMMPAATAAGATTTQINIDGDGAVGQHSFPASGSFFKAGVGFLAWALWGHIPLHDGEQMLSHLFTNVKAKTSFGRGTSTRSAMRKALIAASAAPVDNRRGKKREIDFITNVQPAAVSDDVIDAAELVLLAKTLAENLSDEAMEKEESKNHNLRVRLVRDKLTARRRCSNVLLQRLNLSSKIKKRPDATLFDKMEANEDVIENLEAELAILQEEEYRRHTERVEKKRHVMSSTNTAPGIATTMIGMRTPMIGTSVSFETSGNDSGGRNEEDSPAAAVDLTIAVDENKRKASFAAVEKNYCMECNLIPTEHVCLKCKQVRVCACCCDENRGLRNNTWCKGCFDNETPASQEIIRNGDYNFK